MPDMHPKSQLSRVAALVVVIVVCAACNLDRITPTPVPLPTDVPPLALPTTDPLTTDPFAATAVPAAVNPNCPTTPPTWISYTIEPGDSLGLLAGQTDSTVDELVQGNCLDNPDQIEVGAVIFLPRAPVISP